MTWLLMTDGDTPITFRLPPGAVKTIGRATQADFIVEAALVSRVHCRLTASKEDGLVVEDLDSTNGTLVNGEAVERAVLKTGDKLTVGRLELKVQLAS
jgi:pSer/pThr/pTyr-binding forkhead associated (FHA) protein